MAESDDIIHCRLVLHKRGHILHCAGMLDVFQPGCKELLGQVSTRSSEGELVPPAAIDWGSAIHSHRAVLDRVQQYYQKRRQWARSARPYAGTCSVRFGDIEHRTKPFPYYSGLPAVSFQYLDG